MTGPGNSAPFRATSGATGTAIRTLGTPVNPDLEREYVDEFSASIEHELVTDTALRASYVLSAAERRQRASGMCRSSLRCSKDAASLRRRTSSVRRMRSPGRPSGCSGFRTMSPTGWTPGRRPSPAWKPATTRSRSRRTGVSPAASSSRRASTTSGGDEYRGRLGGIAQSADRRPAGCGIRRPRHHLAEPQPRDALPPADHELERKAAGPATRCRTEPRSPATSATRAAGPGRPSSGSRSRVRER